MKYIKDGDRVSAINENGDLVAYIEKDRFGTHGHWHGYKHFVFCEKLNEFIWAAVPKFVVYPGEPASDYESWTEEPPHFSSVRSFKEYLERAS